jgi:hypothetical protein
MCGMIMNVTDIQIQRENDWSMIYKPSNYKLFQYPSAGFKADASGSTPISDFPSSGASHAKSEASSAFSCPKLNNKRNNAKIPIGISLQSLRL